MKEIKKTIQVSLIVFAAVLFTSCEAKKKYHVVKVDNPAFVPNTQFAGYEDLSSPKFKALIEKYQLDTIFHGETDEFNRVLLLRHWIRKIIQVDNIGPYPGDESAESILDEALKGHGFHCGHYMTVMNAILNGYGYVTRCIGAGEGSPPRVENHHAINEVWLNTYHKWVLVDAKYDCHFEKNGIPLSALEVRKESLKNNAKDIVLVKGPDRVPTEIYPELDNRPKSEFARVYTWITWEKYNNRYTSFPYDSSNLIAYQDDYSRSHVWIRDGKPHWAYNTRYLTEVTDTKPIEWTPNTIEANVTVEGNKALVQLKSVTPNFYSYQVKKEDGEWTDTPEKLTIELTGNKEVRLFRVINKAGVPGAPYKLVLERG